MKRLKWIGVTLFLLAVIIGTNASGQSRVSRTVLGTGGGSSGNGAARMSVTVGQAAIGDVVAPGNILQQGFWYRPSASVAAAFEMPVTGRRALSAGIWPNPSSGNATVVVDLPAAGYLSVILYDLRGNAVRTLHDGSCGIQRVNIPLDGSDLPSGVYTVVLSSMGERAMVAYHLAR